MEKNIQKTNNKINLLLLVCLIGFPQISETIYTPSLTEIAQNFNVTLNVSQMTLSIYFLGFAIGVVFWGIGSDYFGRKKAMNFGIFVYIIGSIICLISNDIYVLFIGRFIQAFGASTGSVTTQTILRDNYEGVERHQMFAKISAALAFSPAIGPLVGGVVGQFYGYRAVFLVLVVMGMILLYTSLKKLPETIVCNQTKFDVSEIFGIAKKMLFDPYTVIFCLLIGLFNGILFSYYAEAPSIFIETFQFTQGQYGLMGCIVASATILGVWLSSQSLKKVSAELTIKRGIIVSFMATLFLGIITLVQLNALFEVVLYIAGIFFLLAGIGISLPNCLSLALVNFSKTVGTSGAFLSLGYYLIISLCTFVIGLIHTGSLLVFPMFCMLILILMIALVHYLEKLITQ